MDKKREVMGEKKCFIALSCSTLHCTRCDCNFVNDGAQVNTLYWSSFISLKQKSVQEALLPSPPPQVY